MRSTQVCDSDTMLDPASSVEMVKVLEEDPMVGGVGGDVQVELQNIFLILASYKFDKWMCLTSFYFYLSIPL